MRRVGGCAMTPHPAGEREPPTPKSRQLIISGAYANDTPLQPQSERSKRRRQWVGPRENHAGVKVPWCSASEKATDTIDKKIKKLIRKDMEQNAGSVQK